MSKAITTLSQTIFSERAALAIQKQPLRRTVNLAELEIIDDEKIAFKGAPIKITKSAFKDLMNILKIPTAFIQRFGEIMEEKPEAKRSFINSIKNILGSRGTGGKTVTLVLSQETKEIVAVHKTERNLISNANFMDVVSQTIDSNSLDVVDFTVNPDGNVVVNALNTKAQFGIGNPNDNPLYKDEFFQGGVSFANDPKNGFIISPYVNRLVCANGSVHRGFQETYKLTSTDSETLQKFFSDLSNLAKKGFKPETFVARVEESMNLKASLSELYSAKRYIKQAVKDIKPEELEHWIPLRANESAYNRIGIETHLLRSGQLKNAKSNITVWELINGMTHFATHSNGFEISEYDRRGLQIQAGKLLTDEHDMSNFVRTPW
jgi:hypothetical protein